MDLSQIMIFTGPALRIVNNVIHSGRKSVINCVSRNFKSNPNPCLPGFFWEHPDSVSPDMEYKAGNIVHIFHQK
jgi:hypothetical protein